MSTYTPGPWSTQAFPGNEPQVVIVADSQMVANTLHRNDEANARLIAAAPDLLQCLQDFLDTGFTGGPQGKRARAAIAKATGAA